MELLTAIAIATHHAKAWNGQLIVSVNKSLLNVQQMAKNALPLQIAKKQIQMEDV